MTLKDSVVRKLQKHKYAQTITLPQGYWRRFLDPKTDHVEESFRMIFNDKFLVLFPDSPEDAELAQKFIDATSEHTES